MSYDLRPVNTVQEKNMILSHAAERDWFLFLEHDPRFAMCKVVSTEEGFSVSEFFDFKSEGSSQ
jgi:hypothetical protein